MESLNKTPSWDSGYDTGHAYIDSQHRWITDAVDLLIALCFRGATAAEVSRAMRIVNAHTVQHIVDEERLMRRADYPNYDEHAQMHIYFRAAVASLATDFAEGSTTVEMVGIIAQRIRGNMIQHIRTADHVALHYILQETENSLPRP